MNRRIALTLGAAAGGLLGAAFLPVAVASADTDPFTLFGGEVGSTVSATELSNLDATLNAAGNSVLVTDLVNAIGPDGQTPGLLGAAPFNDDAFANLLPAGSAYLNQANSLDAILYHFDPTLAATLAADDSTGTFPDAPGPDAFTLGNYTFDPYTTGADTTLGNEGFAPVTPGTGTPPFFETGTVDGQNYEVFSAASGSTTPTVDGTITTNQTVTDLFGVTNTGFDVTNGTAVGTGVLPTDGTIYDVTNFGSGYENVYTDVPAAAGSTASGTVTDTLVTPYGDYDLSSLVSALDLSTSLDPGAAFGVGTDAAGAAADAVGGVDPLAFLGL